MLRKTLTVGVLAGILSITSCAGDQGARNASFDTPGTASGANTDTLSKVKERGTMIVGVKFDTPPFGFIPEGKTEPDGFDVDLGEEIADRLGVDAEFVQVTAKNRMPNLETGKIDIIMASMVKTEERDAVIDFSKVYFEDDQMLLVPEGSDITNVEQMNGKTVALAQGSIEEENILAAAPDVKILAYQTWPEALQAMLRGEADAVTSTIGILAGLRDRAVDAGEDVELAGEGFAAGPVAAGFRSGDDEFREAVDEALVEAVEDGTYADIYTKWWGDLLPEVYSVDTKLDS